jgi:16S rRNA (guanine966-N2)-methyltransferase
MRIIGGRHRGRALFAPAGSEIRPTSDRAREAIFNILAHGRFGGVEPPYLDAPVLDVFAGTGACGLEALSRGAASAVFIENSPAAITTLRRNIAHLGEASRCRILDADATRPPRAPSPCNLVFLDPPYRQNLAAPALAALRTAGWIAPAALCVVEIAAKEDFAAPEGFEILDERRYGAARVALLRAQG